jgi:hypothetical protein
MLAQTRDEELFVIVHERVVHCRTAQVDSRDDAHDFSPTGLKQIAAPGFCAAAS